MATQPHYPSAVTGDVLPEDDLMEVRVEKIQVMGHSHFKPKLVGNVYVEEDVTSKSIVSVELLTLPNGKLVMVYKADLTYGRAWPAEDLDESTREIWQEAANTAFENR